MNKPLYNLRGFMMCNRLEVGVIRFRSVLIYAYFNQYSLNTFTSYEQCYFNACCCGTEQQKL